MLLIPPEQTFSRNVYFRKKISTKVLDAVLTVTPEITEAFALLLPPRDVLVGCAVLFCSGAFTSLENCSLSRRCFYESLGECNIIFILTLSSGSRRVSYFQLW